MGGWCVLVSCRAQKAADFPVISVLQLCVLAFSPMQFHWYILQIVHNASAHFTVTVSAFTRREGFPLGLYEETRKISHIIDELKLFVVIFT